MAHTRIIYVCQVCHYGSLIGGVGWLLDTLLQLRQRAASQSRVKRERGRRDQKDASGKT